MTLETFFEKFDRFADAPGAVGKMRELVLELAIQGKLVAQDGKDEPANKQLERIIAKKAQAGRVARVKARAAASAEPEDSKTHVPDGWEKTSLAALVTVLNGRAYAKDELLEAGTPVLRVGNLFTSKHWYYSDLELEPDKYCDKGDLIFAWSASFGPFIWPGPKVIYHYHIWKLELHSEADLHKGYLYWFLQNKTQEIKRAGHGVSMLHMTKEKMEKLEVMLPPLAEQKRIVAKVDELMALCDQLEAQQQERETRHAALARASLARFADAPTPANLNFLFHQSYAIPPADLRKSILTLAVQGKLVPQDPDDEPAEELLARLEQKRAHIAKEQGVRPPKNVPPLTADNCPHDIPESWRWSRIGNLALVIDYGTSQKADNDSSKVPVYRMGNIVGGRLVDENLKYVDASIDDLPGLYLKTDDILFNRTNSYELVGKAGIYTGPDDTATFASYLIRIRLPSTLLFPPFFSIAMNAPYFRQTQIEPEVVQQCGQANFNGTKLASTVVPIPPLAEQRRIVAKVAQLMALVDELETQLAASRATAANLLSALVAELTNAA